MKQVLQSVGDCREASTHGDGDHSGFQREMCRGVDEISDLVGSFR